MLNTNRVIQRYKLDSRFAKEIDKGILISMLFLIMFGILIYIYVLREKFFLYLGHFILLRDKLYGF